MLHRLDPCVHIVASIPRVVAQALVRLTSLEREHSRTPHPLRSPCSDLSEEESLQVLEAVERVKGWLDAVSLDAAQRLHQEMTHLGWDLMPEGASRSQIPTMLAETATMTATEIAAATGQGALECARRVSFATADPARTADLAERITRLWADTGTGDTDKTRVVDLTYCYAAGSVAPSCSTSTSADRSKRKRFMVADSGSSRKGHWDTTCLTTT